ncbi:uncharacterized protein LOC141701414 [Apium graveolens]|uniref:uncharacterized protein LOC141701414 n=1 Tax=Apium graveolens TaxID=4045 RepID=UPI003D7B7075
MEIDFCSYNIRGLNSKIAFVKDFFSTNKISFCALLETHVKKENFVSISSIIAPRFTWLNNYEFHYNGRIWLGWDSLLWNVIVFRASAQQVTCFVSRRDGSSSCVVTVIYAYNDLVDRRPLWNELFAIQNDLPMGPDSLPWCLLGDFNAFLEANETTGDLPNRNRAMVEFKQCVKHLAVTDLHYGGEFFTWRDGNIVAPLQRKLDRVMVNAKWLEVFDLSSAKFLPRGLSDHCPAVLLLGLQKDRLSKPFQIFNHLIEHEDFLQVVEKAWDIEVTGTPWFRLSSKLRNVKKALKILNRDVGNLHQEVITTRQALLDFQSSMSTPSSQSQREEELLLISKYKAALLSEEIILKQKSRINWLNKGDGNNGFFFKSCKGRWNTNKLLSLEDDLGVTHTSHESISRTACGLFYGPSGFGSRFGVG